MKTYKILFKLKSSVITPFQADTIWGSICWALKYLYGEGTLVKFLNTYNENPPLIISDGFPEGYLPKPVLKPISYQDVNTLAKKYFGNDRESLIKCLIEIKRIRKEKYITTSLFDEVKNNLSETELFDKLLKVKNIRPQIKYTLIFRNTINRLTNTVLHEGGLHPNDESFYGLEIYILLKTNYFSSKELEEIFKFISFSGFGRSASCGKGAMNLLSIEEIEMKKIQSPSPNAFISLSSFIPSENDPVNGYYQIFTKYGKLGGDYAKNKNPFKKPILMFSSGSIFFDTSIKEYYGTLIDKIHPDDKIKHYAYGFPIGVRINEHI